MKKRLISLFLTLAMAASLATSALAYSSPDFSDVPAENWAYKYVMEMADAGVIKGTGAGMFSPDKKVSAEMLLTLVGRIAFPEVKVGKEDTWYGPYVKAAQCAGWLEGTKIDPTDTAAEVTRYDMAVVLAFAAKKLGIAEKTVDTGKIKDFGEIPNKYTTAVTQVYGNGLIKGDGNGNFSGTSTMRRDEAAAVMSRLIALKPGGSTGTTPEQPTDPVEDPDVDYEVAVYLRQTEHAMAAPAFDKHTYLPGVSAKLYYTSDSGETSTLVGEGVSVSESRWDEDAGRNITVGYVVFQFKAPESWSKGKNFYISAETVYEGQKLVTSDLRMDGRAFKNLFAVTPGPSYSGGLARFTNVELTPPTGEKAKLNFKGTVACDLADGRKLMSGFTVKLHFKDGTVLGETVSDANGYFTMDFEVDALDNPFDDHVNQYYVSSEGTYDGVHYHYHGATDPQSISEIPLSSLYYLGICVSSGNGEWGTREYRMVHGTHSMVSP